MKRFLFLLILACITLLGASCNSPEENANSIYIDQTAGRYINLSELADSVSYIQLETREGLLINEINQLLYDQDGNILILDRVGIKGIAAFDKVGKYMFKIQKQGKGPGEFNSISDFGFYNDNIEIYDGTKGKLMTYNREGDFIDEVSGPIGNVEFIHKGDTLVFASSCGYRCGKLVININGKEIKHTTMGSQGSAEFAVGHLYGSADSLYVTNTFDDDIHAIVGHNLKPSFAIDFADNTVPSNIGVLLKTRKHFLCNYTTRSGDNFLINYAFKNLQTGEKFNGHFINDLNYISISPPLYAEENKLIVSGQVDSASLESNSLFWRKQGVAESKLKELHKIFKEVDEMSNPILFTFYLK